MPTGLYRTKLPNGTEVAYIDKDGKPFGITKDRYESQGYAPSYGELPEK